MLGLEHENRAYEEHEGVGVPKASFFTSIIITGMFLAFAVALLHHKRQNVLAVSMACTILRKD